MITCRPDPSWTPTSISRILLYKNTYGILGSDESRIVNLYDGTEIFWYDPDVASRGNISGSIDSVVTSSISLFIPKENTTCDDAAEYRCLITGLITGAADDYTNDTFVEGLGKHYFRWGLNGTLARQIM